MADHNHAGRGALADRPLSAEALWGDLNGGGTSNIVKSAKTEDDFKRLFDQEVMEGFAEKEKKKKASKKDKKTTEAKEE